MGEDLLQSVFIPAPGSEKKDMYNIPLMDQLLKILFSSCQYGEHLLKFFWGKIELLLFYAVAQSIRTGNYKATHWILDGRNATYLFVWYEVPQLATTRTSVQDDVTPNR